MTTTDYDTGGADHAYARTGGALMQALADEWDQLCQSTVARDRVRSWGNIQPELDGLHGPAEVIEAIKGGEQHDKDAVLRALILLFQTGKHAIAGRIVLQAMLPKIRKMSRGDEERRCEAVTAMWEVIATYPARRRTGKIAAGLALDTLHRLPRLSAPTDTPLDPQIIEALNPHGMPGGQHTSQPIGWEVLEWAVERAVISPQEADLLDGIYLQGGDQLRHRQVGSQLALTEDAVRQRCSRAVRRISAAVKAAS